MSKIIDQVNAALVKRMDQNKDGALDKHDVAIVLSQVKREVEEETKEHPLGALIMVAVASAVLGFWACRLFC